MGFVSFRTFVRLFGFWDSGRQGQWHENQKICLAGPLKKKHFCWRTISYLDTLTSCSVDFLLSYSILLAETHLTDLELIFSSYSRQEMK